MKRNFGKATIASAVLVAAGMAFGGAAQAEPVKLVTGNGYKPFTDNSLKDGGVATDIVRHIYKNMGHEVSIDFKPWKRGAALVKQGKRVATFPYVKNEERSKNYHFSKPFMSPALSPMVLKENAGMINSIEDFKGKTGCLPTGWSTGSDEFAKMKENGEVKMISARAVKHCFRMLKAGRVGFVPTEVPNGLFAAKQVLGSSDKVHVEDYILSRSHLHLMFAKNEKGKQAAQEFNQGLKNIKESGEFEKIKEEHL